MTAIGDVLDYLSDRFPVVVTQAGLRADQVLDGPAANYAGSEGVAVGATATDTTGEFNYPPGSVSGEAGEESFIPCLVWAGWGETTFRGLRARVKAVAAVLSAEIARDRSLGNLVHDTWVTGGIYEQTQTTRVMDDGQVIYTGALVTQEIRIQFRRF